MKEILWQIIILFDNYYHTYMEAYSYAEIINVFTILVITTMTLIILKAPKENIRESKEIKNIIKIIFFILFLQLISKMLFIEIIQLSIKVISYFSILVLLFLLYNAFKKELGIPSIKLPTLKVPKIKFETTKKQSQKYAEIVEEINMTIKNQNFDIKKFEIYFNPGFEAPLKDIILTSIRNKRYNITNKLLKDLDKLMKELDNKVIEELPYIFHLNVIQEEMIKDLNKDMLPAIKTISSLIIKEYKKSKNEEYYETISTDLIKINALLNIKRNKEIKEILLKSQIEIIKSYKGQQEFILDEKLIKKYSK